MILLHAALMLFAAGQPAAEVEPYAVFDRLCAPAKTIADVRARAEAAGWSAFEPEGTTPLGYVVQLTRHLGGPEGDIAFQGPSDTVYVWVRETIPGPTGQFVECKVFDFATTAMPADDVLKSWAGRRADQSYNMGNGGLRMWFDENDNSTAVSIETPACMIRPCQKPRLVIERSVRKSETGKPTP